MKTLITMTAILFSMNAFSSTMTATVKESFCGEIDPFAIGDACLVYLETSDNKKLSLVLDFDESQDEYEENELKGSKILIQTNLLSNINGAALDELRSMNSIYFYQSAPLEALTPLKNAPMDQLLRKMGTGYFYIAKLPAGYSATKIKKAEFKFKSSFRKWLSSEKKIKLKLWKNLVLYSGEFDYLSSEERELALTKPEEYLGVPHLLEIYEIFEIKKGSKIIGYYTEISDHIQAAEYQDGAWMEVLLNLDQEVVRKTDESA